MELKELKVNVRERTGNGYARSLRRDGMIPAILYGPSMETVKLSLNVKEFEQAVKNKKIGQVLLNLVIQNGKTETKSVMIKEIQSHPLTRKFRHIDFYEIAMDRKIRVKVPVVLTGKSVGVDMGGMLQQVRRELEVLCLPLKIPGSITIDISGLEIGGAVHVRDISLEEDIEVQEEENLTIVTVLSPKREEKEAEEGEEELEGEEGAAEEGEGSESGD